MVRGIIRRNWRTFFALCAMVADACIITGTFFFAAKIDRQNFTLQDIFVSHKHLLVYSLVVFIGFFTALGVYRTVSYSSFQRQALKALQGYLYGIALILSSLFLAQSLFYSRFFLLLFILMLPGVYSLVWTGIRAAVNAFQDKGYGRWNTLAIGSERNLKHLVHRVENHPELGYDIVDILKVPHSPDDGAVHVEPSQVQKIVEEKKIGLIVFSTANLNGTFDKLEKLCRTRRIPMRVVSPESDYLFSIAHVQDIAGIPLFTPNRKKIDLLKAVAKRTFDIVGAMIGLIILSPLLIAVAIATKFESPGPVFFKQKRSLTDHDEPFEFYKFRSMYHAADEQKDTLIHQNETNGALFKIKNDPRLTNVGRIIRKYSIDELPQLFNVLQGNMSLVGPRPLPARDFDLLEEEDHMGGYFRQRAHAKPGMTGLWQISGRSDLGFREMVLLDLYYIENQTILFDLEILAQTIPVVMFGKGAY